MRFDVRVGTVVDEWHASRVSHEPEGRLICDAGLHRGVPFNGQAEPELWLSAKGATVSPRVAGSDAVHRAEGAVECFGGAVSVAHCGAQQVAIFEYVGRGDVILRRRMYSDNGMPASDENILRT